MVRSGKGRRERNPGLWSPVFWLRLNRFHDMVRQSKIQALLRYLEPDMKQGYCPVLENGVSRLRRSAPNATVYLTVNRIVNLTVNRIVNHRMPPFAEMQPYLVGAAGAGTAAYE